MTADKSGSLLLELKGFCAEFASERLEEYTAYIQQPRVLATSAKEVNDPIWGTIKLKPIELAILDSPLVQRLRFIRQLGVVHWTYPGAAHTRFEHTLGVLHQTQQLITAINNAAPAVPQPIDETYAGVLRLSALLHDIGHGVFSHVSEHALVRSDKLRNALTTFAREQRLEKVQLSELVAFYLVGSPAFQSLLERILTNLNTEIHLGNSAAGNAASIIDKVQSAIIGKAINDSVPLMHELISGPLDADKLDYFVRDARMAGIPAVLDISRLTQKITVEFLPQHALPKPIGSRVAGGYATYTLFGLKWSGAAVLDELHLARILLYSKIYRHQKVLAAEAMIEALFDLLLSRSDVEISHLVRLSYSLSDDQMLWASPTDVLRIAGVPESETDPDVAFIADVLERLRNRRLYVKALAVRASYPGDPWADDQPQKQGLRLLVEALSNPVSSRQFREELVAEVSAIANLLPDAVPPSFPRNLIKHSIIAVAKSRMSGGTEIDRSFIFHSGKPITYRDLSGVNRHAWADAYDFSSSPAIVFCPREVATATYIAAEKIIRNKYNVILPPSARELSKQREQEIEALKNRLQMHDYYRGTPFDLRARPARLNRADMQQFLDKITAKLETIDEAPGDLLNERRPPTLRSRIELWLSQFQTESCIEVAMEALRCLRVLSREDTRTALKAFIEKHREFKGATVLILGSQKDSSAIQGYYSQDVADIVSQVMTVEEAASKRVDGPVLFLDDFIGTGSQVADVLGNWFDFDDLRHNELDEQRNLFGTIEKDYLRSKRVGFVFVAGWNDGIVAAREACSKLGLDAEVFAHLDDSKIPFAFADGVLDVDAQSLEEFRVTCEQVGRSILLKAGKSLEVAQQRALGYGNRAMLLVSRYNVPSQVLTCIWRGGDTDDFDWKPLLHRRTKK